MNTVALIHVVDMFLHVQYFITFREAESLFPMKDRVH